MSYYSWSLHGLKCTFNRIPPRMSVHILCFKQTYLTDKGAVIIVTDKDLFTLYHIKHAIDSDNQSINQLNWRHTKSSYVFFFKPCISPSVDNHEISYCNHIDTLYWSLNRSEKKNHICGVKRPNRVFLTHMEASLLQILTYSLHCICLKESFTRIVLQKIVLFYI